MLSGNLRQREKFCDSVFKVWDQYLTHSHLWAVSCQTGDTHCNYCDSRLWSIWNRHYWTVQCEPFSEWKSQLTTYLEQILCANSRSSNVTNIKGWAQSEPSNRSDSIVMKNVTFKISHIFRYSDKFSQMLCTICYVHTAHIATKPRICG